MTMTVNKLKQKEDAPVIIADHNGFITFINQAFQRFYGWTENDLIGKPLLTIIPKALRDAHSMGFSRFLLTEKTRILQKELTFKIVCRDGKEVDAKHFILPEKQSDHWVFAATIEPVEQETLNGS